MPKTVFQYIPRYFFLLFIVFFLTSLVLLFELFRSYQAEAELFVLSKSPSISTESAVATIARVPLTLSFYDRLLVDHSNISDPWVGKENVSRKKAWLQIVRSERYPETSIIRFSIVGDRPTETKALLDASLETLYGFSGRLYDREREVDIRLFEETTVQPFVRSPWILFASSGIIASVLALIFSLSFGKFSEKLVFRRSSLKRVDPSVFEAQDRKISPAFDRPKALFPVPSFSEVRRKPFSSEETVSSSIVFEKPKENVFGKVKTIFEKPEESKENKHSEAGNSQLFKEESTNIAKETVGPNSNESDKRIRYDYNRIVPFNTKKEISPVPESSFVLKQTEPGTESERITPLQKIAVPPEKNEIEKKEEKVEVLKPLEKVEHRPNVAPAGGFPGNLETIPARDFSWEKYLFQGNGAELIEEVDEKNDEAKNSEVFEKREPTPEELKERLNQLLRGEI